MGKLEHVSLIPLVTGKARGDKIARVNSIRIKKFINLIVYGITCYFNVDTLICVAQFYDVAVRCDKALFSVTVHL